LLAAESPRRIKTCGTTIANHFHPHAGTADPLTEPPAIAEVLTDMDRELAALEQRRAKTRALKQGMMQALLTGRIRPVESGILNADGK
jgi:hypothetical protein